MRLTRCALALACLYSANFATPRSARADLLHRVELGETWSGLAKRFGVSIWDLALANHVAPTVGLVPGQELRVPPRGVTFVRPGQTLSHIAQASKCSVAELQRLNRLDQASPLSVGARLVLPRHHGERQRRPTTRDVGPLEVEGQQGGGPAGVASGSIRIKMGGDTGAPTTVRLLDDEGRVMTSGLEALAQWMAKELPEGATEPEVHPRLALLLARISQHFDGREIQLYSGFRKAGGTTSRESRHVCGRAADILVSGVSKRALWEFCRSLDYTGCGLYPRSLFVHVDARPQAAQWVDWSGPGQRARYGTLRGPFRRRGRKAIPRVKITRVVRRPLAVPLLVRVVDDLGRELVVVDQPQSAGASDVHAPSNSASTAFKLTSDSLPPEAPSADSI